MTGAEAIELHRKLVIVRNNPLFPLLLPRSIFNPNRFGIRNNSAHVQDAAFGDSGKGSVAAKIGDVLSDSGKKPFWSGRINGGGNAGHEIEVDGITVCTHTLPVAIAQRGATAFSSRGEFIHPSDVLTELDIITRQFKGDLPSRAYVIDSYAEVTLDTHRVRESAINSVETGGTGSTGSGISSTRAAHIDRHPITIGDLMSDKWEGLARKHYRLYQSHTRGFNGFEDMADIPVGVLGQNGKKTTRKIGTEAEFIDRLAHERDQLRPYVVFAFYDKFKEVWENESIPVIFEGAQAQGLDEQFGVSPDYTTGGRPGAGQIMDATYGIASAAEVAVKVAVGKPYLSDVGIRRLLKPNDPEWENYENWVRKGFNEFGKTTDRARSISPINVPMSEIFKRTGGWDYLVMTHLDASREGIPIRVITHMTDKITGQERPYLPYQRELDKLDAHYVEFPGWDGEAVKQARTPAELPYKAQAFLTFAQAVMGKVMMATHGPGVEDYIPFWKTS